jgi:hypothetical protein
MGFIKLTSARSAAIIGTLLVCSSIGWLAVLSYEHRNVPDWLRYELIPPRTLRVMFWSGILLLIGAGCSALYKFLNKRFRH